CLAIAKVLFARVVGHALTRRVGLSKRIPLRLLLRLVSAASQVSYLSEAGQELHSARRAGSNTLLDPSRRRRLELDAEGLRGGLAGNRPPLLVAEARRLEDVVDRLVLPGDRMVGPDHEPIRPHLPPPRP